MSKTDEPDNIIDLAARRPPEPKKYDPRAELIALLNEHVVTRKLTPRERITHILAGGVPGIAIGALATLLA